MYKFIYKNTKTGKKIYSNKKLDDKDLILVTNVRDSHFASKSSRIIKK